MASNLISKLGTIEWFTVEKKIFIGYLTTNGGTNKNICATESFPSTTAFIQTSSLTYSIWYHRSFIKLLPAAISLLKAKEVRQKLLNYKTPTWYAIRSNIVIKSIISMQICVHRSKFQTSVIWKK